MPIYSISGLIFFKYSSDIENILLENSDILLPRDEALALSLISILILPFLYCVFISFKNIVHIPFCMTLLDLVSPNSLVSWTNSWNPLPPNSNSASSWETLAVCFCHVSTSVGYFLFYRNRVLVPVKVFCGKKVIDYYWFKWINVFFKL